jgi:sugar/nucleoside kinase (ribokinase family)
MPNNLQYDCVVCGEICVDLPIRPIDQHRPLRGRVILRVDPIQPGGGGIVANSGGAMGRLGLRVAACGLVGDDDWADVLIAILNREGVDTTHLRRHPESPTSATAVLVGDDGEHTFAYHSGASRRLDRGAILSRLDLFAQAKFALFGYYALMPELEHDLPEVLREIQSTGCSTALDAAGGGGSLQPLDEILPCLDIYVPSFAEAKSQTGRSDPREMIQVFRQYAPHALLGVKLGAQGALLSPSDGAWIEVQPVEPPRPVIDTTGAGDCFYAGLIAGLARGLSIDDAGRLAAAAGALSVTQIGAIAGLSDFEATCELAGLT